MDPKTLAARLVELTGRLKRSSKDQIASIQNLQESLAKAMLREPEMEIRDIVFHTERTDSISGELLEETPLFKEMKVMTERLAAKKADKKEINYRVFRRTTPTINSQIPGSTPRWGRGAAIAFTEGPFFGENGLVYWFDFYTFTKTISIYFGNEAQPSLLIPVKLSLLGASKKKYKIDEGSVWIRSNLFTPTAPAGQYTGLKIDGGTMTLGEKDAPVGDKMVINAGANLQMELDLVQPGTLPDSTDNYGVDVKNSSIQLPTKVTFTVVQNSLKINELARAKWKLFTESRPFKHHENANASYSPLLDRVLVPMLTEPNTFVIPTGTSKSSFNQFEGEGFISQAAWSLPTAAITLTAPPEAAGIGGLALLVKPGITSQWSGLKGGKIEMGAVWFQLEPGALTVTAQAAGNIYANQKYRLWENEKTGFFSEVHLQYTDAFIFRFSALNVGIEAIFTQVDTNVQTDRPVKVDCSPFEIKGKDTLFLLFASTAYQGLVLYDQDIIVDQQTTASIQNMPLESHAIALNNALLTVTQPASFIIAGELAKEDQLKKGILNLLHGLYYLIPTLPDPYAANLGLLIRDRGRNSSAALTGKASGRSIAALLLCTVSWPVTTPQDEENPLNANVSYQFLPLGNTQTSNIGLNPGPDFIAGPVSEETPPSSLFSFAVSHNGYQPEKYEGPWRNLTQNVGRDIFSLLDVSTNADMMGVTYGFLNEDYLLQLTHVPTSANPNAPAIPYQIEGMDFKASGKYVKAFTVPQISWEPVINLSDNAVLGVDPPPGLLAFPDDGGPTRIFNDSVNTVTLAPIPLTNFIVDQFKNDDQLNTYSFFTLPFGLQAVAKIDKKNQFDPADEGADIDFNKPQFPDDVAGGIQLKTTGAEHKKQKNRIFKGNTIQLTNLISSAPYKTNILGEDVTGIFNNEFSSGGQYGPFTNRGVPLERIDFSGYGASMFNKWFNNEAQFAQTSQTKFDVWVGRTAHEIIQVRSVIYPYGIYVVRTITLFRVNSAYVYRVDSGWRAETDGIYDFNFTVKDPIPAGILNTFKSFFAEFANNGSTKNLRPYAFHPGLVKGVYNVQNIQNTADIPAYTNNRAKLLGEAYMDQNGDILAVQGAEVGKPWGIKLSPVYFTADVEMDFVKEGKVNGRVPSKKLLGFVQISPAGVPIPRDALSDLLVKHPDIGGDVDCVVDIGNSSQKMRVNRIKIDAAKDTGNTDIFVATAKGSPILPPDGSWSMAEQKQTGEINQVKDERGIPLIREGEWTRSANGNWSANQNGKLLRFANARELLRAPDTNTIHYAFLQNTGSQKALFRLPRFEQGKNLLLSEKPDFADAYHLLNSKGIFPNLQDITDTLDLGAQNIAIKIQEEGYNMIEKGTEALANSVDKALAQVLPEGPWYWVGTETGDEPVKIYLEYKTPSASSVLNFDINSQAKSWGSALNDTAIVVDLGPFSRLFIIKGNFNSAKGSPVSIDQPIIEFGPDLKPIYDVLRLLATISQFPAIDYAELLQKGLEIAMSNTPEVWEYKFSAKKEIPIIRFPPPSLDSPVAPMRIEASLAVGAYFNESLSLATDVDQLLPSAGAFVEFYAQLSVMCVSVAAATVYAVGQTKVKLYADLKDGPGIAMRFGIGVELAVGLPVVGTLSLTYMAGIDMDLNAQELNVDAFLMFKGRAEILGGIVTVTIMIEARGGIQRIGDVTNMHAQVTFGLDISIFLVINISFEESWEEERQLS
ncbi:MAG: hypothetical protein DHS20C18_06940 [Saprospiraceae bacterium]|nr:MAG: hypothetical protein DHS20C18_06940 [Saprospiraceae bacterium]